MPLNDFFLHDKSALVLISTVGVGILTLALTNVAYIRGAYYQPVKGSKYSTTYEYDCKEWRRIYSRPAETCPAGSLVFDSMIVVCISLLVSSFALLMKLLGKPFPRILILCWMVTVLLNFAAGAMLILYLVSVSDSVFPQHHLCPHFYGVETFGERNVKVRAAPAATKKDYNSCESIRDYVYKYKLLIAAAVFAIVTGVMSIFSTVILWKKSGADEVGVMGRNENAAVHADMEGQQPAIPQDGHQR